MIDLPNPFPILAADPAVTDLIGDNPVRCYPHGQAPQGLALIHISEPTRRTTSAYAFFCLTKKIP